MNQTLKEAIIIAGQISALQDKLAGVLNCRTSETGKKIAELMAQEELTTATVVHAGRTFSATIRKATADTMVFDTDKAKAMMQAAGLELPVKLKKGAAATAIIK